MWSHAPPGDAPYELLGDDGEWFERSRKRMRFNDERADGLHADTPVCGECEFPRDVCSCANGRDYKETT